MDTQDKQSTPITTVFFDVGQTLLTTAVAEGEVFSEEARRHGVELDPAVVQSNIPKMYEYYEHLYDQDDSFWSDDERAINIWLAMYEYLCELTKVDKSKRPAIARSVHKRYFTAQSWKPFDDVVPTLKKLKERNIRMGLISNWDSSLEGIIDGLGLAPYFDVIISSAAVQLHKPMPEIFTLALERMGTTAAEAMHIGDHLTADVEGALAVGITPVLLSRNNTSQQRLALEQKTEQLKKSISCISTLIEILAII
ncbi:MAG: HAD-IA family hydrolase [Coriobacteriia bacterium]|nr:HAD-IA family hydrolase [Coriobacteriia bacterium]MDR2714969.1 HAD-IA family hydrolase [Coriobacteriales bacterium]